MTAGTSSWTDGYVAELDYTHGYYREMSPAHLELAMLSKLQAHRVKGPVRYLELGFGQGLSLNIHAAACAGEFWGTDFNPAQAANALELAAASGASIRVLDASFAELALRDDLPEFDVIVLHGIWSWISDENRKVIAEIARRRLAVGGILYVSYNTTPGWSAAMPLRHLMSLHVELASPEAQGLAPRIDHAIAFAESVVNSNALYFRANPAVAERLKGMKGHNRNYLAHEFFNADWHPMPFSEAAGYFQNAKLTFAASANLTSHVEAVGLTEAQQQLLASISHPVLRESVRDYCENQQFRRDIFVKGARTLSRIEQSELMSAKRFMLTTPEPDVGLKINGPAGEVRLQDAVYRPILAALASDKYRPKTVAEIASEPGLKSVTSGQIMQALIVLAGLMHVSAVQSETEIAARRRHTAALNGHLISRAVYSSDINHLASPVTGAGIAVGRLQQLFLGSIARGRRTPEEWAGEVWPIMEAQGQRLIKEGKTLATAQENLAELTGAAKDFFEKRLPILEAMQVVDRPEGAARSAAARASRSA